MPGLGRAPGNVRSWFQSTAGCSCARSPTAGAIAGMVNINNIVRGRFQSGSLSAWRDHERWAITATMTGTAAEPHPSLPSR